MSTTTGADLELIVDIGYTASLNKMQTTLDKLMNGLKSSKPTVVVDVKFKDGIIESLKSQLAEIQKYAGGKQSGSGSGGTGSSSSGSRATKEAKERVVAYSAVMDKYKQMTSLINSAPNKKGEAFDSLSKEAAKFDEVLNLVKKDAITVNEAIKRLGHNPNTFLQGSNDIIADYKRSLIDMQNSKYTINNQEHENLLMAATKEKSRIDKNLKNWSAAKHGVTSKDYDALKGYSNEIESLYNKFHSGQITQKEFSDGLTDISRKAAASSAAIQSSGRAVKSFGDKIKDMTKKFSVWLSASQLIMYGVRAVRVMITNVVNLDTAMTELKKVTDETDATYEKFLKNASTRAQKLGASLVDVVNTSADFARLGLTLENAETVSDAAIVYKNVGDGIQSIDEASQSIISTMQAFGIEAKDVMTIVDKFNTIGNNFAISSGGVGEAFLRSASAMASANNTIDQTAALIAAANTVVQNPESVGTSLKTVSMYLRAAKTEAEEAGESTDGMANSISELRYEIYRLTGNKVDIFSDNNTYKSTYEIFKDLSEVWHDLSDVSQANILELIGGKRNSNINSAILENFDIALRAVEKSANSSGSALAENEKVLSSIGGKYTLLKAEFQELSSNLFNNTFIKILLDVGRLTLNFLNLLGSIPGKILAIGTTIAVVLGTIKTLKGLTWVQNIGSVFTSFFGLFSKLKTGINVISAAYISTMTGVNAVTSAVMVTQMSLTQKIKIATVAILKQAAAWIAANGAALAGIGVVAALAAGVLIYKNNIEKTRQEQIELGKETAEASSTLSDLVEQYKSLGKDGVMDTSDIEQAKNIHEKIRDLIGEEADNLNLISGAYDIQLKKLKDIQVQRAANNRHAMQNAMSSSEQEVRDMWANVVTGNTGVYNNKEAVEIMNKHGMSDYINNGIPFFIDPKNSSMEDILDSYNAMISLRTTLNIKYEEEMENSKSLKRFYDFLSLSIDDLSGKISTYKSALSDYDINEASLIFNNKDGIANNYGLGNLNASLIKTEGEMNNFVSSVLKSDKISNSLKTTLIGMAKSTFPNFSDSIDETVRAFYSSQIAAGNFDYNLENIASQFGLTTSAAAKMVLELIKINNTKLNLSQQIAEITKLRLAMGMSGEKLTSEQIYGMGVEAVKGSSGKYGYSYKGKWYNTYNELYADVWYDHTIKEIGDETHIETPKTPTDPDVDKNKTNEPLDNYLKYAENLYKVHQNEEKYINDLRWAYNNLTKEEKERLDIEGKINEAYRDLADNRIKDLEHQNELLLAQGKTEYELISNYRQMQDIVHAEAERLRDMGYDNNSNEIQDLQKKWLDYDKKILDADLENSKKWIEARKNYGDWRSWGDSEVEAWGRVLKRLREDYPNAVEEIAEVEKEYRDAVLDGISRYYEDQIEKLEKKNELIKEGIELQKSQYEALLTLQQKYFENYNFVEDTKSEIQKELDASMAMYKYLDEDTRKLLFNEDDYTALSDALDKLNEENENLKTVYQSDIWSATAETIEEVTQHYEQQFELRQKEYEILKASLDVEKKRTELNNVLNERNTKMFINGQWQWVANAEDVKNAQEALADAELEAAKTVRDKEQTLANQELESHIARLETQSNFLDKELKVAQEKWEAIEKSLEEPVTSINNILKDVAESGVPQLKNIVDGLNRSLKDLDSKLGVNNANNSSNNTAQDENSTVLKYDKTQGKWVEVSSNTKSTAVKLAQKGLGLFVKKDKVYDSGGVASGKGFLAKAVDDDEIVLPPYLSRLVLNPEYSERFKVLTQGLESMFKLPSVNMSNLPNIERNSGGVTYDNRTYIDGISLTEQESEALSSVLRRIIPNH